MNHEFALTVITSLITGPGLWGIFQLVLSRKQKAAEDRRDKQAEDSQTWYRESRHHYEVAKDEAAEAKQECADCMTELRKTQRVIYRMLEDIDEQIITMLQFPDADLKDIRLALRQVVNTARESL